MKIAFTLCSNNYLAHAKTLGDSFLEFHSDFKFVIGLVDEYDTNMDYSLFSTFEIIPLVKLKLPELNDLVLKYNIIELNTSVKPSYFKYLFETTGANNIIYIDPDILVLSRLVEVIDALVHHNIIITPHILTPIDDEFAPTDYHTIRGGVFNLGFIALSNYSKINNFLNWWENRVMKYGFADFSKSMFYDQLWVNYVPVFYDNHLILKHPGYNMANWNLHERHLTLVNGKYIVNDRFPLRFFHFSSYNYTNPDVICSYQTRYDFNSRKDLLELFKDYRFLLLKNDIENISNLQIFYSNKFNQKSSNEKKNILKKIIRRLALALQPFLDK
ncbi:glycosyl transferase [Pedobacter riviphilus]|uniref:Glycosyl transferase n=1 Tax=Pedobacter riviphilus TaxID=2766984 RepID=A0ABX6TJ21_9SPHI|nr:glycosyl transferase [Pedobacter riviphilus]QNR85307.1 glycosyl transferase [Pedobacter riviphilus]